jgi:CheY-like chemotaxis protein
VDSNQLELALLNLALNARDAMPSGGTLTILAAAEVIGQNPGDSALKAGEYVRVGVSDTGAGMDEATLAKATDPFFTTKGPGKGTGLGLSMVHGLAAQSGGQLRIVSTPGVGTTVELWLPRAKTDAVSLVRSAERPAPAPAAASWRVLIVDDDLLVLTGMAALIEDLGHVAIEVPSASEALAVLASGEAVDVIVTDHAMPNMTGLQLAHCVQEKYPGMPIVLATGYAELPADPAHFGLVKLAKPCSQTEIAVAIQTAMSFAHREKLRAAGS